jgi:hypothetical protein
MVARSPWHGPLPVLSRRLGLQEPSEGFLDSGLAVHDGGHRVCRDDHVEVLRQDGSQPLARLLSAELMRFRPWHVWQLSHTGLTVAGISVCAVLQAQTSCIIRSSDHDAREGTGAQFHVVGMAARARRCRSATAVVRSTDDCQRGFVTLPLANRFHHTDLPGPDQIP